jgi:ferredoxin-nitrate reductase
MPARERPPTAAHRVADVWGERTPYAIDHSWPSRVDLELDPGIGPDDVDSWVTSACLLCSNGCGLDIAVKDGRMVGVRGRPQDRVNHGRLGPKGLYGWRGQRVGRLTRPLVRDAGRLVEASWEEAMGRVVAVSRHLLDEKGPLSHAFYTSGQLMTEDYYTLAVLGKAGIGTPHMDGNTRLCTATAAAALKESFGTDGQPGSYTDIDHCDALFSFGHNVAATQTVLWARMLDRLDGADPPRHVTVDPRRTPVAERSEIHLAVTPGTNLALMNGLTREVVHRGWVDAEYVAAHTQGFESLCEMVEPYGLRHVAEICGVTARDLEAAAEVFGTSKRVLSTVLQGFYQSHQATASAIGVNNLHLLRGMIGRPGSGILQMNGQPTAQNNREAGANGDLSGFRNWENEAHVQELANLWDVDPMTIPHWSEPTHVMQILRYIEQGSIGFLWVSGTNPAVSLPELGRARELLASESLFLVVNDAYPTETTELADVVLPCALWGERPGTYTNVDRTVHLSDKAVEPPGEARSDLEIWVDYARRMGFTGLSGGPIPAWDTYEGAFDAWKECSRGRPCDYSGLSYDLLRERGGMQWPVTSEAPDGTERLYSDGMFNTGHDYCETYGHDLATGGAVTAQEHAAARGDGRARLKALPWTPPPEDPDSSYPLRLTTGRAVHHFHTRTKTGRVRTLAQAAPDAWVEIAAGDAQRSEVRDGELAVVESVRGRIVVAVRITDIKEGTVFVPFHYGDLDPVPDADEPPQASARPRAANELTVTAWDPVSKQPTFKSGAVRVRPARPEEG